MFYRCDRFATVGDRAMPACSVMPFIVTDEITIVGTFSPKIPQAKAPEPYHLRYRHLSSTQPCAKRHSCRIMFQVALQSLRRISRSSELRQKIGFGVLRNAKGAAQFAVGRNRGAGEPA